jgi:mannose-6-phosphate isomerase-like protein (cupin superfamily)
MLQSFVSMRIVCVLAAAAFAQGAFAQLNAERPAGSDGVGFTYFRPGQIKWAPSASIPPGGLTAVVYGDPRKVGPYITRVKLPADYRIAPHKHPEERVYTVVKGTFYIGFGETFDQRGLVEFPVGSVFVVPANASHFHWMRSGEAIVQISGTGPSGIAYQDGADDPRK